MKKNEQGKWKCQKNIYFAHSFVTKTRGLAASRPYFLLRLDFIYVCTFAMWLDNDPRVLPSTQVWRGAEYWVRPIWSSSIFYIHSYQSATLTLYRGVRCTLYYAWWVKLAIVLSNCWNFFKGFAENCCAKHDILILL